MVREVTVPSIKRRLAILLAAALLWTFGAAACGVQEGQEEIDQAREVEKQMEEKLREGQQKVEGQ